MRIMLVTFANRNSSDMGVGCYFNQIADVLEKEGHELIFFNHPTPLRIEKTTLSRTIIPMFSGMASKRFAQVFEATRPDAVHIQTEVGLGISARHYCVRNGIPFSTAYHTHWDIGMKHWAHLPASLIWSYLRWYYKPASLIHTNTTQAMQLLRNKGIQNPVEVFPPGVDSTKFYYDPKPSVLSGYPRPYFMSFCRIAKEKNLEAFLDLSLPGTKFIIGHGPYKKYLQSKYEGKAVFLPHENVFLPYDNLRTILSAGDVFVFPSRFDSFGFVNLEALACGLPVAAYPMMGPLNVIEQGVSGYISENLQEAALGCLSLKKEACIERASHYSWTHTAHNFLKHQIVIK